MSARGTYVYCLIAGSRKPANRARPKGPTGTGAVRLIEVDLSLGDLTGWLVVADAPLDRYGEGEINRRLNDLDWVARAAVAHEEVIESFVAAAAILPMKLFTIFTSDERAAEYVIRQRDHIEALLRRVTDQEEWGVRVVLDRARSASPGTAGRARRAPASGARYLAGKKAQQDATAELGARAREVVGDLYEVIEKHATLAKRRAASELPARGGPLLLDAAVLVARPRARQLRATLAREARRLEPQGYRITLTGPWPPYSFLQD